MADVTLYYNENPIFSTSTSTTETIQTAGKYCAHNLSLVYTPPSSSPSSLPTLTNPATASDILSGKEAIDGQGSKLTGTYSAPVLPTLTNPAAASDILSGKETIDGNGNKLTGTLSVFTSGSFADLCSWLTRNWDKTEFTIASTTSSSITVSHNLREQPTNVLVYPKADFINAFIGMAYGTYDNNTNNRWGNLAAINGAGLYKLFATRMQSSRFVESATANEVKIASTNSGSKVAGTYILAVI